MLTFGAVTRLFLGKLKKKIQCKEKKNEFYAKVKETAEYSLVLQSNAKIGQEKADTEHQRYFGVKNM